jgi:hypothetical protein
VPEDPPSTHKDAEPRSDKPLRWWSRWGKCASAISGGAVVGFVAGASAGAVLPVIGPIACASIGALGGALTGAAQC